MREKEANLAIIHLITLIVILYAKDMQTILIVFHKRRVWERVCLERAGEDGYFADVARGVKWWKVKRSKVDCGDIVDRDGSVELVQTKRS
jgi:hypothetical protein